MQCYIYNDASKIYRFLFPNKQGFRTFVKIVVCMGNWSEQQEAKKEVKEKEKTSRETLGKFFYDLAKLVFTAMALVGGVSLIIDEPQIKQGVLLATGMLLTYIFASIGYNILKDRNMDFMIMFFSICLVIGIGILIWFKTKSGKRWLANL